ncbi:MAG: HD domain-containing protein [Dysgonamonadaceae bacterium]|jgi:HD superfamily phosphohydrolase|nr:HD domain-containing protein [Dysgonamonadaceae bacterium]
MAEKRKIINDPVFGFINISDELIFRIIQHPYFQRLNRIRQLGLAYFIYPGAQHSRLSHSLGAMYLMNEAIAQLRLKGHSITPKEESAALACILMHDLGHGPFSHVLEHTLVNVRHEEISLLLMQKMNESWDGILTDTIAIFTDTYPKKFLHQLVSGQLDVDRLDYLRRDSFFTGVTEGNIGSARIIKMLNVKDDRLVVEAKGIYSIENFLMARRLMFWQVYLHKTSIAAEKMLVNTLRRAKFLSGQGVELFASPALHYFLYHTVGKEDFIGKEQALSAYADLDDSDIWSALKVWAKNPDRVLSLLSGCLLNRNLFKIEVGQEPFAPEYCEEKIDRYAQQYGISREEAAYFVASDEVSTNMYNEADDSIDILYKDGTCKDIADASDMLNIQLLSKKIKKYYFCFLRE